MKRFLHCVILTVTIAALPYAQGCSDDDVTAPAPPPGCQVTECVSLTLSAQEWDPDSSYSPGDNITVMWASARVPGVIENVSPGDRIQIEIDFDPVLVVTDHVPPEITVSFRAWDQSVVSFSGFGFGVDPRSEFYTSKDTLQSDVRVEGNDATGSIDWVASTWAVTAPAEGDELRSLAVEFTIPDQFDNGDPIAADQTIYLYQVIWSVAFSGDRRGSRMPVEPMSDPPATAQGW